ncbi:MAG TPA: homocysteine S-methyltransferase family protein [Anaerolineales bacterium]|nr:homocysteine S-methyltransferase family protein [Anaerolineales bacterium]
MSHPTFQERIQSGAILVADGATGTNLLARGLPNGITAETWVLENPAQIVQLHQDFIAAGANIILTSTFSASPLRLAGSPLAGREAEINQRAVTLARQAAGAAPILVGGSLGPAGQLLKPYGPLEPAGVTASYAAQARFLAKAGVDLLVVETQFDLAEARAAIQGVRSVSSLPLVCSFSYDRGKRTMMGISPSQAGEELSALGIDVIGINCGRSLEENLANLQALRQATHLPLWFKPNAGLPRLDENAQAIYDVSPQQMGQQVSAWLAAGAQIVGGCCGTSPKHLEEIAKNVAR